MSARTAAAVSAAAIALAAAGAGRADPLEDALLASTPDGALAILDAAVVDAPSATAALLRGALLASCGRPAEAFASFAEAADAAAGEAAGAAVSGDASWVVAGLAWHGMRDLAAYLPRETLAAAHVAAAPGGGPWALWARLQRLRLALALAAILGDAAGAAAALENLHRTPVPVEARGRIRNPSTQRRSRTAEADLAADRTAEVLIAVTTADPVAATIDGLPILDADPAVDGPTEHWIHLRLPRGRHRLRVETRDEGGGPAQIDIVAPPDGAVAVVPAEPTEISLGVGVEATLLRGDPASARGPIPVWLAARTARIAGDQDRAAAGFRSIRTEVPDAALPVADEAETIWARSDLPADVRRVHVGELLEASAPAGLYAVDLMKVVLLHAEGRGDEAEAVLDEVVERYPADPGPALVAAQLAEDRGEHAEAERYVAAALRATGRSCRYLAVAAEAAEARGDAAARLALAEEAGGCDPSHETSIAALLDAQRHADARALIDRALATTGDARAAARWTALAALRDPDAAAPAALNAALAALRAAPDDASAALRVLDAAAAAGDAAAALPAVDSFLALQPGPHLALRLAAHGEPAPWTLREDGRRIAAAFEAVRPAGDPRDVVAVLDQVVIRVFDDGSAISRVHRVVRLGSDAAVAQHGHQRVPPGARILRLRTVHPDGAVTPADERHGETEYPLQGLAAGDYAEIEYAVADPPHAAFGGAMLPAFYFAGPDEWMERSEMVVIAPAGLPIEVDASAGAPVPERTRAGDLAILRWVARDSPPTALEPWSTDAVDALPNVRACVGCTLERFAAREAERIRRGGRVTPEMGEFLAARSGGSAATLARDLYEWAGENVRSAPASSDTAAGVFARRSGDRTLLLYHLLRAAGIDAEIWRASPAARGSPPPGLWFPGDYAVSLLRFPDSGTWVYADEDGVPFGVLPPNVVGRPAIRVAPKFAQGAVTPAATEETSRFDVRVRFAEARELRADLTVELRGLAAVAVRQALAERREDTAAAVRPFALWMFEGAAAIENVDARESGAPDGAIVVTATVRIAADVAVRDGFVLGTRWTERFAFVPERSQPMVLPAPVFEEWTIRLHPIAGDATALTSVLPFDIESAFGSFRQAVEPGGEPGTIVVRRTVRLPARRIEADEYAAFRSFAAAVDEGAALPLLRPLEDTDHR